MQFPLEGHKHGEKGFYVTLSETKSEIEDIAISHGWDLGLLDIFELSAFEELAENAENTVFHPSEIELNKTTDLILLHRGETHGPADAGFVGLHPHIQR